MPIRSCCFHFQKVLYQLCGNFPFFLHSQHLSEKLCNIFRIFRENKSTLSYYTVYQFSLSYIKGRVPYGYTLSYNPFRSETADLLGIPLLDLNFRTCLNVPVDSTNGCSNIERDIMMSCKDREGISADLVSRIAVHGDSVRTYDHGIYMFFKH